MSTLLVTLTVVCLAIATAVAVAVRDPDQPATLRPVPRRDRRREKPPRRKARPVVAAVAAPPPVRQEAPERGGGERGGGERGGGAGGAGGFSEQWMPAPVGISPWVRLRSGVVLTLMLTAIGAVLAASISGLLLLIALAVRDAVS